MKSANTLFDNYRLGDADVGVSRARRSVRRSLETAAARKKAVLASATGVCAGTRGGADAMRGRQTGAGGVEFAVQGAYLPLIDPAIRGASMANPLLFLQQVRSEVGKVVWPSRREVLLTTIMVFIMAALTSVFFFLVDTVIQYGLTTVLGVFG